MNPYSIPHEPFTFLILASWLQSKISTFLGDILNTLPSILAKAKFKHFCQITGLQYEPYIVPKNDSIKMTDHRPFTFFIPCTPHAKKLTLPLGATLNLKLHLALQSSMLSSSPEQNSSSILG